MAALLAAATGLAAPLSAQAASCTSRSRSQGCHATVGGTLFSTVSYYGNPREIEVYAARAGTVEVRWLPKNADGDSGPFCTFREKMRSTGQEYLFDHTCRVPSSVTVAHAQVKIAYGSGSTTFGVDSKP